MNTLTNTGTAMSPEHATAREDEVDMLALGSTLAARWRLLLLGPVVAGAVAYGASFLITPTFTAKTTLLPPQQQQSMAASALSSLSALAGLAGGGSAVKSPAEQYVALMQSVTVSDRLIDAFKLQQVYETKLRSHTRVALSNHVRIALGKKDGLIGIEVDDESPQRAADIANAYVDELRRITGDLAVTEAQQRRKFFEEQLKQTRERLVRAQQVLEASGFNPGALNTEPKAAADAYGKLKAEATAAEIRLRTLQTTLSDTAVEVQQARTQLGAIRAQLQRLEAQDASGKPGADADYIGRYREFKYQESLFELFSKQFEAAKVDESREGTLIQVVDRADVPDQKSKPHRSLLALGAAMLAAVVLVVRVLAQGRRQA